MNITTDGTAPNSKKRHVANPIVGHGKVTESFVAIANDLVRDATISSDAYRVLCLLLSHSDGYEESISSIAERYGWGRVRARNAFHVLEEHGLLIRQKHLTADKTQAYEKYHVHRAGLRFTADEVGLLGETVVLNGTGDDSDQVRAMTRNVSGGWPESSQGDEPDQVTTEQKEKHNTEEKGEVTLLLNVNEEKQKLRPEVRRLVDSLVPDLYDRGHLTNIAVKAMAEGKEGREGRATLEHVETALKKFVARGGGAPRSLFGLIEDAMRCLDCDLAKATGFQMCGACSDRERRVALPAALRECLYDPEYNPEPLERFGEYFSKWSYDCPLKYPRDGSKKDVQEYDDACDAWYRDRRREWLMQLQDELEDEHIDRLTHRLSMNPALVR
jgi:hypothetical protein